MAALVPAEPGFFFSPRSTAAPRREQQTCRMPFLLDILCFESGHCPAAEGGGRREGTPGLQISIKGLVDRKSVV